jgi:hypothetical protein
MSLKAAVQAEGHFGHQSHLPYFQVLAVSKVVQLSFCELQ